jgi:hypothetical protein
MRGAVFAVVILAIALIVGPPLLLAGWLSRLIWH